MKKYVSATGHLMLAEVSHDELLPAQLVSAFDARCENRMTFRGVAADNDDQFSLLDVADRSGIAAIADGAKKSDRRRSLAVTRAVIHIIGADNSAGQLLHQIALFVGALGRRDEGERIGAGGGLDFRESARNERESFVPGSLAELSVLANQRGGEAVFAVDESPAE